MKKFFFAITLASCISACQEKKTEQPKNTDLIAQNLKGTVKTIEERTYIVDSATGNMGKMDSVYGILEFNDKGYQTKYMTKDSSGKIKEEQDYDHYDNGAAKEMKTTANGKMVSRMTIDIDKDGKYSLAKTYDSTNAMDGYYTNITQNEYGEVLSAKLMHKDSTLKSSFESVYDSARFVSGRNSDSVGKVISSFSVKLNDKGDPIEQTSTNVKKDSTVKETITFRYDQYDAKGNWIQRTTNNDKGKPTRIVKRTITYYKD